MDVNDLLVFVRVAQSGSFTQAAHALGMPVSTVSRRVAELEDQLGIPLIIRTTRSLKVTEVGRSYLEHGKAIAAQLETAESLATHLQSIPQGILKITAPTDFGNQYLGKIVRDYLELYPRVEIETVLTERVVDLVEEGFDLAIRIGELEDSSLVARRLGEISLQLFASPEFIQKHGEPKTCTELSRFECIRFLGDDSPHVWRLKGPRGTHSVAVMGKVLTNNMAMIHAFAVAGQGIALMPNFLCSQEIKSGQLKLILKDWAQISDPVHVVYPNQRFLLPKVRTFIDHLTQNTAKIAWKPKI